MGSFIVVVESPQPSHLTYLAQGLKQIGIQELIPERAIETLRKSVLLWLAFLYVDHLDAIKSVCMIERPQDNLRGIAPVEYLMAKITRETLEAFGSNSGVLT